MDGLVTVRFRRLHAEARIPSFAHPGDAGMDVSSAVDLTLAAGGSALVRTGLAMELPAGTEAQVRPRSGLALKHRVTVLNSPGTIDEGYRGELCIILINHGNEAFQVERGMRIAQIVVKPVLTVRVEEVADLSESTRGSGGFGSTGR